MAPTKRVKTNRVCFTLNNYSAEEQECLIQSLNSLKDQMIFSIVGQEKGASGTPHLQGFIRLKPSFLKASNGTISKWKSLIPSLKRAHLEPAFGSDLDSQKYCSKEGSVLFQHGTPSANQENQFSLLLKATSMEEIIELDPEMAFKHYFQATAIIRSNTMNNTRPIAPPLLRSWQVKVLRSLVLQNSRQVTFVVDEHGNTGKSVLAKWIAGNLPPKSVFYCRGGKSSDIVHAFSKVATTCKFAIFDYARNKLPEYFAWDLFEELKDGGITSLKYDGNCFWLPNRIKVLVLTNHLLDDHRYRLTSDRWDVHKLDLSTRDQSADVDPKGIVEIDQEFNLPEPEVPAEDLPMNDLNIDDILNELLNDFSE
nr:rep protein [Cressdnaviricota sp.]